MDFISKGYSEALSYARIFIKWLLIAAIIGVIGGLVGSSFHLSVDWATGLRERRPWFLWLLPAAGLFIAGLYRLTQAEDKNTNTVIDSVRAGGKVPLALLPAIYLSTVITHMFGGSAGREGAALQIGGSIGGCIGRSLRLDEKDMGPAVLCGMSALFSALFGTPLTATVFALEVVSVGIMYYSALVPCIVSAIVAFEISSALGIPATRFALTVGSTFALPFVKICILAVICSLMSAVFCLSVHKTEHLFSRHIPNPYLRIAVGGALVVIISLVLGSGDYNGAGMSVISAAVEQGRAVPTAFICKLLLTAITLGCGFKGGEVVPCFFVGATLGCTLGPILGIPAGLAAAVGLVCVFCGAVNCPIASIILSVELFGASSLSCFALACGVTYMLSGYFGLYKSQKIMYSKLKAEYINVYAK